MLLGLNLTITALIYLMIWQNKAHFYSDAVIYAAAVYTVFRVCAAVYDTIELKKVQSPALYSAKALSISVALMSLFSLQTALIDRFADSSTKLPTVLNIFTGTFVGIAVIFIAIRMLFKTKNSGV
jgi:uncharacterized protein with PQ loop repeat